MATLRRSEDGKCVVLAARGLVGRSSLCTLRLADGRVSGEHARLAYASGQWSLFDLGSRNGTFVNGERLPHGKLHALGQGDELAFGDPAASWTLVDVGPPRLAARRLSDGVLIEASHGVLLLPSEEAPRASVFESRSREWVLESASEVCHVLDGQTVEVDGERFQIALPAGSATTMKGAADELSAADLTLSFRVSRDEEHVEVSVVLPGGPQVLPPRAHHYTLLTLARARLRDASSADLVEAQRGWLFVDDLCRSLAVEETRLNVEIHRIRQDFAALGVGASSSIVERRRGSRQLRLATPHVTVSAWTG